MSKKLSLCFLASLIVVAKNTKNAKLMKTQTVSPFLHAHKHRFTKFPPLIKKKKKISVVNIYLNFNIK